MSFLFFLGFFFAECRKCVRIKTGEVTCCGQGGSWQGKCGPPGSAKFEHTWGDGLRACVKQASKIEKIKKTEVIIQGNGDELSLVPQKVVVSIPTSMATGITYPSVFMEVFVYCFVLVLDQITT